MMTRVIRYVVCMGIALGAQLGFGGQQASAQTYNFTFTCGVGCGIANGVVISSAGSITSIAGTATGLSAFGLTDGGFSYTSNLHTNNDNYTSPSNFYFNVDTNGGGSNPHEEFQLLNGTNISSVIQFITISNYPTQLGTTTITGTPAPVPGAGTLSWLVLGLGIAVVRRKAISAALRVADTRIAGRASA